MAVQAYHHYSSLGFQDSMETYYSNNGIGITNDFSSSSQYLQQYQDMIQRNQFLGLVVDPLPPLSDNPSMGVSPESMLAGQVEKQRREIDGFITLHNERLRLSLQEQRKQQQLTLFRKLESKALNLLRQKDEDLAKATGKTMELEDCIRKLEIESQAWKIVAQENESMVIALNNTLEQVRENACGLATGGVEDAESCCCESSVNPNSTKEAAETMKKMVCKICNSENSCVLFLPCRHLSSCKSCESLLDYCPVCNSVKKACIDVFMS